jgi:hypothetical protein
MNYITVVYSSDGPSATITLNRPEDLNTIVPPMTDEIEAAVAQRDALFSDYSQAPRDGKPDPNNAYPAPQAS